MRSVKRSLRVQGFSGHKVGEVLDGTRADDLCAGGYPSGYLLQGREEKQVACLLDKLVEV